MQHAPSAAATCRAFARALALGLAWLLTAAAVGAAPVRDRLTLLVPDGASSSAWQIKVWTDSAAEEGVRMELITDAAFLALGSNAASRIAGLVLPDSAHILASDALVAAVKQYVAQGGRLMLVYDAGAQTDGGFFPTSGNSRFADLAGVQYVLWDNGLGAGSMIGFGTVLGTAASLDSLSFPPGKYMPYVAAAPLAAGTAAVSAARATTLSTTATATATSAKSGSTAATSIAAYVPATPADPGGATLMANLLVQRAATMAGAAGKAQAGTAALAGPRVSVPGAEGLGLLRFGPRRGDVTDLGGRGPQRQSPSSATKAPTTAAAAATATDTRGALAVQSAAPIAAFPTSPSLQAISGYLYGPLSYYSYVTTGAYAGDAILSSPDHGLVAGRSSYGNGQVLFVNLPLGYFKAIGTDGAPLHGFLSYFARDQVGLATQSLQPRGKGGLVFNWHIDGGSQLNIDTRNLLNQTQVFNRGPYSLHFTAGPDVDVVGDGLGMALTTNASSRDLVQRLGNLGAYANLPAGQRLPAHELGSHGGWIHNYWGATANEANVPDLTSLLTQNFSAIQGLSRRSVREYSSPTGNTPLWAIRWIENKGVNAMYLVGDIGASVVRSWRAGTRVSNRLWTFPVTPMGQWATFEEFDANGVTDAESGQWLLDLQAFVVNHRTSRLFYSHPPGAVAHLGPVNALLARADTLQAQGSFAWYTMSHLADHAQRRVDTTWTTSVDASGAVSFNASHPSTLTDVTWLLPKAAWGLPVITGGSGVVVTTDATHWLVTANGGRSLRFKAVGL